MIILLAVYACEPNKGSEPEVGWQMINQLSLIMPEHTFHVITKGNNRTSIEKEGCSKNVIFHYYSVPQYLSFWKSKGCGIRTYYYFWMLGAVRFLRRNKLKFDIIHHVTFVNDWLPSFFYKLKTRDNSFIWGPIGSHDPIASKFLDGWKQKLIENIRIFLQVFFRKIDPSFYFCKNKADCIIGINQNVYNKINIFPGKLFKVEPAIGITPQLKNTACKEGKGTVNFEILSAGRLIYIKNFKLTIFVFASFLKKIPNPTNVFLDIVGSGPERNNLIKLVNKLDLNSYVRFLGHVPLEQMPSIFERSDIFLFPTLENAGFVILEAMSSSLPILALDYGGPAQFIKHHQDKQLVSADLEYDFIVEALADKLLDLYLDRNKLDMLGKQNKQDVNDFFTWNAKSQVIKDIYEEMSEKN